MSAVYNRVRKFTLKNDVRLVETILQLNPTFKINEQNNKGWTVLMYAAWLNRTEVIDLLIRKGADLDLKDANGHTAFDKAANRGHGRALQLLQDTVAERRRQAEQARALAAAERFQTQHEITAKKQQSLYSQAPKLKLRAERRP